ncbi:MAG: DUF3291 domain-containing protein [Catenulispora sp.]|nr:DUF3291 domain-containing protein [Catenulispora sp.]
MATEHHIAQLNLTLPAVPADSPEFTDDDFVESFDKITRKAQFTDGYVWRLFGGSADGRRVLDAVWPDDPRIVVNLSVWETFDSLREFVYRGAHADFMRRRAKALTVPFSEAYQVLWWIPAWTAPTVAEARERLLHLREHGPSPYAFTFTRTFPPEALADQAVQTQALQDQALQDHAEPGISGR